MELRQNAYVPADVVNEEEELEKLIYRSENTVKNEFKSIAFIQKNFKFNNQL